MMDLDSAIQHCEEVAEVNHKMVESLVGIDTDEQERCRECAKDHEQLAEWLKELKAYREQSGDAISREAVLDIINFEDKWLLDAKGHNAATGIAFSGMKSRIADLPSVTPQQKTEQQRTGRWERMSDLPNDVDDRFKCSHCGNIVHYNNVMNLRTFSRWCGRCGSDNG